MIKPSCNWYKRGNTCLSTIVFTLWNFSFGRGHCAHPHSLQSFDLLVQAAVDVTGVEQGVSGNLAQQVSGKVADVVFAEVPLPQHSAGNHSLCVLVAALAEVTAEVFAITQPLDVIYSVER